MSEDNGIVRKLITATITDTEFLKGLRSIWHEEYVGKAWAWIARKSFEYLDEYGQAPFRNIETLWQAETQLDQDTKEELERLLAGLSKDWETLEEDLPNTELLLREARNHFKRELILTEIINIEDAAEAGDVDRADRLLDHLIEDRDKINASSLAELKGTTARELQEMDLPEPEWLIRGIVPAGLTLLSGKPKSGKSYLMLNMAVQLASGSKVFDMIETEPTEILYLGLEEPPWMTRKRIEEIIGADGPWSDNLHFFHEWPKVHEGGKAKFEQWLNEHPKTRLIIIDTFQKVRKPPKARGNPYPEDYEAGCILQELAKKHGIGVVAIHHNKKTKEADVFDEISGSTGLTASTDSNLNFRKVPGPNQNLRQLHYQGRLLMEGVLELTFENHRFYLDEEPPGCQEAPKRKVSPARQAVLNVLEGVFPYITMTRKNLIEALSDSVGSGIEKTLSQMVEDGQIIRPKPGVYAHPDHWVRLKARDACLEAARKRRWAAQV